MELKWLLMTLPCLGYALSCSDKSFYDVSTQECTPCLQIYKGDCKEITAACTSVEDTKYKCQDQCVNITVHDKDHYDRLVCLPAPGDAHGTIAPQIESTSQPNTTISSMVNTSVGRMVNTTSYTPGNTPTGGIVAAVLVPLFVVTMLVAIIYKKRHLMREWIRNGCCWNERKADGQDTGCTNNDSDQHKPLRPDTVYHTQV